MSAVTILPEGDAYRVTINTQRLGAEAAEEVRAELQTRIPDGTSEVTIDVGEVEFADSSGIGALVFLRKRLGKEANIRLINTTESMKRVFALVRMEQIFTME